MQAILDILTDAVVQGASEVVRTRIEGAVVTDYKDERELVTTADKRSDAAILSVFRERFPAVDPEIVFQLEESGFSGAPGRKIAGADPLDGTNHFAANGNLYSVQAHYVEDGVPRVGVIFQPEIFIPLAESENCTGRIAYATRGGGAFQKRTVFRGKDFAFSDEQRLSRLPAPSAARTFVACVPLSTKMTDDERERASRVHRSGIIAAQTGTGGAGGNVMMIIMGGQHVYANFGAGDDLDLIPPQVIATEVGLTVWGMDRKEPVWRARKQPFVVAPSPEIAEIFLRAAGILL
jgi:3'-phosphoadenosine 5'-phosphosulfate (PAPS) 3'-phosphatase